MGYHDDKNLPIPGAPRETWPSTGVTPNPFKRFVPSEDVVSLPQERSRWKEKHEISLMFEGFASHYIKLPFFLVYDEEMIPDYIQSEDWDIRRIRRGDSLTIEIDLKNRYLPFLSFKGIAEVMPAITVTGYRRHDSLYQVDAASIQRIVSEACSLALEGRPQNIRVGEEHYQFPVHRITRKNGVFSGIADVNGKEFPVKSTWSSARIWELAD